MNSPCNKISSFIERKKNKISQAFFGGLGLAQSFPFLDVYSVVIWFSNIHPVDTSHANHCTCFTCHSGFRYNPYVQARSRIDQLKRLGHSVDKVWTSVLSKLYLLNLQSAEIYLSILSPYKYNYLLSG